MYFSKLYRTNNTAHMSVSQYRTIFFTKRVVQTGDGLRPLYFKDNMF